MALKIVSNGTTSAINLQNLRFRIPGTLVFCSTISGNTATKGDLLFQLDKSEIELRIRKLQAACERAQISYEETLLGFGATGKSDSEAGKQIRRNLELTSGLAAAKLDLQEAGKALQATELRAPFDGVLANISTRAGDYIEAHKPFAVFYDPTSLVVKFKLPEGSAFSVRKGMNVIVKPVFMDSLALPGKITAINPSIDENGMIEMTAGPVSHPALLPGMNMAVEVEVPLPPAMAVSKEAVIYRSGKPVVFTYEDGRAKWNYVKLGRENGKEVQVLEGLKEGDMVITTNIVLLDHDSPIEIVNVTDMEAAK